MGLRLSAPKSPHERLRFRALRCKTLPIKNAWRVFPCDLDAPWSLRSGPLRSRGCTRRGSYSPKGRVSAFYAPSKRLAHQNRSDFCDLRLRCPSRTPEIARSPRQGKAMLHCDLRVRWKVASDLRFGAAISRFRARNPFFLRTFWRFGSVSAEIASDCDCAILVR